MATPRCSRWAAQVYAANSSTIFAFAFLVGVGVTKTLLTKLLFAHSPTPVAFSILSCVATDICLLPILLYKGEPIGLSLKQLGSFAGICLAIAIDLACQNVALAILSVALQQCIKATLPTATVLVESIIRRKRFHWAIYVTVVAICVGPILVASGSSWKAKSEAGSQTYGGVMMLLAVVGGAFKYVLCHKMIKEFQEQMGVLAFTFWVEIFVGSMLLPWALLNGEARKMIFETENTAAQWAGMWVVAAIGGVRVIAQFYFLAKTSATSLAMSGVVMQALTILIGIAAFGTPLTALLATGVLATIGTSSVYAWLKTSSVLDAPAIPPADAQTEMETRIGLRAADSANVLSAG